MSLVRISLLLAGLLGTCCAVAHHAAAGLYDRNNLDKIKSDTIREMKSRPIQFITG